MMKNYLIIPDIHIPYHDLNYIKLISKAIQIIKPLGIVQLGDALDFFQVSKYEKNPARKNDITDDILTYKQIIQEWCENVKEFIQLEGNHEHRLTKYVWTQAKELHKIVKPISELLKPKFVDYKFFPLSDWKACQLGDCILHHGWFFNQHVAVGNLVKYPYKIITGHTHRFQYVSDGKKFSITLGHGSNESETMHNPVPSNWQQAFGILTLVNGISYFEAVLVFNGRAIIKGQLIDVKKT